MPAMFLLWPTVVGRGGGYIRRDHGDRNDTTTTYGDNNDYIIHKKHITCLNISNSPCVAEAVPQLAIPWNIDMICICDVCWCEESGPSGVEGMNDHASPLDQWKPTKHWWDTHYWTQVYIGTHERVILSSPNATRLTSSFTFHILPAFKHIHPKIVGPMVFDPGGSWTLPAAFAANKGLPVQAQEGGPSCLACMFISLQAQVKE